MGRDCFMNRLALGTVQFGLTYGITNQSGKVNESEIAKILQLARVSKIDSIDTAISYGSSEESLGKSGVKDFKIVTKLPHLPKNCSDINGWVELQVNKSLLKLRVNKLYGLLLHQPYQLKGDNGIKLFRALELLKEKGKVDKIGISIYSPNELNELTIRFNFDLIQAPFNLIDRRIYTSGWLNKLKDDGVEVHSRSVFLQGLLLMNQSDIPNRFFPWQGILKEWHEWLLTNKITAVEACIAFQLYHHEIDRVLVGVESANQLTEIVNNLNGQLITNFPNIQCEDEELINPTNWNKL
jgi:aryl-alcohol dehydrogenase-like predicted oxidoreductase